MSKLYTSLSLMLLISLKINGSDTAWNTKVSLSETVRLESKYVSAAAELFKHSNLSEVIDREYCEPIVANTQKEYPKKDGTVSMITTEEILTAIASVRKDKKALLNELTDSYSNVQKISKRSLKRFESEVTTQRAGNEFLANKLTAMYEYAFAAGKLEGSSQIGWKKTFTPIAQEAAAKGKIKSVPSTKTTGVVAWLFGQK